MLNRGLAEEVGVAITPTPVLPGSPPFPLWSMGLCYSWNWGEDERSYWHVVRAAEILAITTSGFLHSSELNFF